MRNVRWISDDKWACLKHTPSLQLPESQLKCWLCGDERPEMSSIQVKFNRAPLETVPNITIGFNEPTDSKRNEYFSKLNFCEWGDCLELSRPNSKYCSRDCSNKNARKRYVDRKKVRK